MTKPARIIITSFDSLKDDGTPLEFNQQRDEAKDSSQKFSEETSASKTKLVESRTTDSQELLFEDQQPDARKFLQNCPGTTRGHARSFDFDVMQLQN